MKLIADRNRVCACGHCITLQRESTEVFRSVVEKEGVVEVGSGLLSHGVASALPSTLVDFTAGFGMGPGVSPPLLPPTPRPLLSG